MKQPDQITQVNEPIEHISTNPQEQLVDHRHRFLYEITKRTFDLVACIIGLFLISPLLLIICILIRVDSPGPVFVSLRRIGRWGKPFGLLKFRTMYMDLTPIQKSSQAFSPSAGDPRVTRVGMFLRKTALDELPQLCNVLTGEMSLVGPRPALVYEFESYTEWHKRRLEAIPGMTGVWQLKEYKNVASMNFDQMVRLDILYFEMWSIWLDLYILFATVAAVFRGQDADRK